MWWGDEGRQVLDRDGSGEITSMEFCETLKKLVRCAPAPLGPAR